MREGCINLDNVYKFMTPGYDLEEGSALGLPSRFTWSRSVDDRAYTSISWGMR